MSKLAPSLNIVKTFQYHTKVRKLFMNRENTLIVRYIKASTSVYKNLL